LQSNVRTNETLPISVRQIEVRKAARNGPNARDVRDQAKLRSREFFEVLSHHPGEVLPMTADRIDEIDPQKVESSSRTAILSSIMVLSQVACGGGSSAAYENARAAADAKEAQARTLGVASPCTTVEQCGTLTFGKTTNGCEQAPTLVYSRVSSTARQAEAATNEQQALAAQAIVLAPVYPLACPQLIYGPVPICNSNACVEQIAK
jgi:hypothetical protein